MDISKCKVFLAFYYKMYVVIFLDHTGPVIDLVIFSDHTGPFIDLVIFLDHTVGIRKILPLGLVPRT